MVADGRGLVSGMTSGEWMARAGVVDFDHGSSCRRGHRRQERYGRQRRGEKRKTGSEGDHNCDGEDYAGRRWLYASEDSFERVGCATQSLGENESNKESEDHLGLKAKRRREGEKGNGCLEDPPHGPHLFEVWTSSPHLISLGRQLTHISPAH